MTVKSVFLTRAVYGPTLFEGRDRRPSRPYRYRTIRPRVPPRARPDRPASPPCAHTRRAVPAAGNGRLPSRWPPSAAFTAAADGSAVNRRINDPATPLATCASAERDRRGTAERTRSFVCVRSGVKIGTSGRTGAYNGGRKGGAVLFRSAADVIFTHSDAGRARLILDLVLKILSSSRPRARPPRGTVFQDSRFVGPDGVARANPDRATRRGPRFFGRKDRDAVP